MTTKSLPSMRALPPLLALGLVAACTSQTTILPSRDLDRPTDITFVCMGAFGGATDGGGTADASAGSGLVTSGRPMSHCHSRNAIDPAPDAQHRTFGFMPNSANGLLSVVDADSWKLVDLDLSIAGFNQYPLGRIPTQIASSDDGCRMFTANRGSCDLTMVNPAALMQKTLSREVPGLSPDVPLEDIGQTIQLKHNDTTLRLLPQEVALLPRDTSTMTGDANLCTEAWTGRAIVTFPSCNLIALVDLPSGQIVDGLYVRRLDDGRVVPKKIGARLECPVDCQNERTDGGTTGAADDATTGTADADDAGAAPPTDGAPAPVVLEDHRPRPGPIAIVPGGSRAYVGLADAPFILAIDLLTPNQLVPARSGMGEDQGVIVLHGGAVGTTRLRLSIDPYAPLPAAPGFSGNFVGGTIVSSRTDRKYLYAIARDGSLRVVHVGADPEVECETNLDQSKYGPADLLKACLPVEGNMQNRRPGAQGPGLRFPAPPVDIAAADVASSSDNPDNHSETSVAGAHAWVLAANGTVYLVNIDPVERFIRYVESDGNALMCQAPATNRCAVEPPPVPNTPRNRNFMSYTPTLGPSDGPPRLDFPTSQQQTGPRLESIWTRGTADNATSDTSTNPSPYIQTQVFFPEPSSAISQAWLVSWEGSIMSAPRASGQIRTQGIASFSLFDPGNDFCRQGIQERDLVALTGCTADAQCGMGYQCRKGSEGTIGGGNVPITGLCIKKDTPKGVCDSLLSSVRRYEVTSAGQTTLGLRPRMDELIRPDSDPCVVTTPDDAADGGAPSDGGAGADGGGDDDDKCTTPNDPSATAFRCVPYKRPEAAAAENRCLMPCKNAGVSDGCRAGRICVSFAEAPADRANPAKACSGVNEDKCFCADGPDLALPGQDMLTCFDELLPYQLQVGRGFLVLGGITGVQATRQANGAGLCEDIPGLDPRTAMRIPLNAPHCTNVEDNTFDSRCNPTPGVDMPCANATEQATGLRDIARRTGAPNPCLFLGGPNETDPSMTFPRHVHAVFRNEQVQFMVTNLEVPVSGTYQMRFEVHGGFRSQTVYTPTTVEVGMPARIVLGPFDAQVPSPASPTAPDVPYLFVVDQLRLGRTAGGGRTRGQLLRIQPRGQPITSPVPGQQPWFEDFTKSGELFPIQ